MSDIIDEQRIQTL